MAHERTGKTRTREAADKTADDHHNGGISRIDACDPIGFGDRQFPERGNRFLSRVDFNGICAKRTWRNSIFFLKDAVKMRNAVKTASSCNVHDWFISVCKQKSSSLRQAIAV